MNAEIEDALNSFHEYWKEHGEPHPSSNAYLRLNRIFFYNLGYRKGIEDYVKVVSRD